MPFTLGESSFDGPDVLEGEGPKEIFLSVADVRSHLDQDDTFKSLGADGSTAEVGPVICECGYETIGSLGEVLNAASLTKLRDCP